MDDPKSATTSRRPVVRGSAEPGSFEDDKPKTIGEKIQMTVTNMISMFMAIVHSLHTVFEAIADVFIKIYRIFLFCYRKPAIAKELIVTTFHLIKVSYDAEIWSWSQIFEILKSQLVTPMTKQAPPTDKKKKKTSKTSKPKKA